jgi:cytosine permease
MNEAKSEDTGGKLSIVDRLDALYEYEREPVSQKKLHGWKTFIAMFAGEHIAGTEFVLGTLMVMHGVSAKDFFLGLLIGNLLAVLSWAFICAPVAVKTRLTIYWQLRKTCGPYLMLAYSAFFAIILCLLAGAMVNVAVTSISIPFNIPNPNYMAGDVIPSVPWILLAVVVGILIAGMAVLGFEKIAAFSKVCAPWTVTIFIVAGLAGLSYLGCNSIGDFWNVITTKIFTGVPLGTNTKYSIWHVIGFAWLCNASQHIGMADITTLRYAKKWTIGFASAFGMYLGHYIAWIASGILCAAFLASGGQNPQPGTIALFGAGLAGAITVVIAGWTTANPTLYRAGLALQVVTPNWKRWKVTYAAGIFMIITACIPAVNANLDRILGYNGLFFMPLGALLLIDIWVFPKIGMVSNFAEKAKIMISWPAAVAWIGSFLFSVFLYGKDHYEWLSKLLDGKQPAWLAGINMDLLFMAAPEWVVAVTLYLVLSIIQQKRKRVAFS